MSNVLIGIIGVILFIGLALAGALYLGGAFSGSKTDSEAARFISEGAQISNAYDLFFLQEGRYPDAMGNGTQSPSDAKIEQLVSAGYLKDIPVGGLSTPGFENKWYIDEERSAALTFIGTDDGARNVCQAARKRLGFTDAPKSCQASDISPNDPCCVAS